MKKTAILYSGTLDLTLSWNMMISANLYSGTFDLTASWNMTISTTPTVGPLFY